MDMQLGWIPRLAAGSVILAQRNLQIAFAVSPSYFIQSLIHFMILASFAEELQIN
jgi:hypothetical protein